MLVLSIYHSYQIYGVSLATNLETVYCKVELKFVTM